mgnify:CR=1 FL=1
MKKTLFGLVLAAALGCGKPVTKGEVTEKSYSPEKHYINFRVIYIDDIPVSIPFGDKSPESYHITLRAYNPDGTYKAAKHPISKQLYDCFNVGDLVDLKKDYAECPKR